MKLLVAVLALSSCAAFASDTGKTLPPDYRPPAETGVIRIWGHSSLVDIARRWQRAYRELAPELRVELNMSGSNVAMAGLYTGNADLALLGREATASEIKAFEWVYQYKPSRIEVMTGSFDQPGRSAALVVFVHDSNPLKSLTLAQLDAMFSHTRRRGSATAIETWGDLGLGGDWNGQPIGLYTFDTDAGTGRYFREAVLGNSRMLYWDRLTEVKAQPGRDTRALQAANRELLDRLSRDRFGLAVGAGAGSIDGVKAVALAECATCEPVAASRETVANRRYPLARSVFAYFNRPADRPADAHLMAFLDYVLDRGQLEIREPDGFLPLRQMPRADTGREPIATSLPATQ